jgi:hypothetical protein
MDMMPQHQWYSTLITGIPRCAPPFPTKGLNYRLLTQKVARRMKFDIKIIDLHFPRDDIDAFIKDYKGSLVFIEYWSTNYIPMIEEQYPPLIYTSLTHYNSKYPGWKKHVYIKPSERLWRQYPKDYSKPKILITPQQYGQDIFSMEVRYLERKGHEITVLASNRDIPFSKWIEYFKTHNIYIEVTSKSMSLVLEEAMFNHMAIIVKNLNDFPLVIRDGIDGFVIKEDKDLYSAIDLLSKSPEIRKEWGDKARKRLDELCKITETIAIFEEAFQEAMKRNLNES